MRQFIIATNKAIELDGLIAMDTKDLPIIFNQDTLNVLSEEDYKKLLDSKYMFGIQIDMSNYLKDFRNFLSKLISVDSEILCIFDASIKRYINKYELNYFANNKLLPSKLFNIEINASEDSCEYQTIGLKAIGLKEFYMKKNKYLNEEDFQTFKAIVTHFIIGKQARIYVNGQKIAFNIEDKDDAYHVTYRMDSKIYDYFRRDDDYLNRIRYELIKHNFEYFKQMHNENLLVGEYLINKAVVNDIANFELGHVEEFVILTDEINYDQDNLFYARRFIK